MDIKSIALFIVAISNFILAIIIYRKSIQKTAYQIFYSLFAFFVGLWAFTMMMYQYVEDVSYAKWWIKLAYISAVGIACSFLYFILFFPTKKKLKKSINFFICFFTLIIVLLLLTNFLVENVIVVSWGKEVVTSLTGHLIFAIYFVSFFFGAIGLSLYKYRKSTGLIRDQLRYIFFGITIPGVLGAFFNLAIPLFWNTHRLVWLGPLFTIIMVLSISYAIIRYRLMDIRVATRKSFIYVSLSLFAYTIFYATAHLYKTIWGDVFATQGYVLGIFVALAFTALFFLVQKNSQKFVNKYLYASVYNTQKTLENLADRLNTLLKLDEVINSIVDTIMKTLGLDRAGVLLRDFNSKKYKIAKTIGFNEKNGISLVQDNFLTKRLKETGKPLVFEELELIMRDVDPQTKKNIKRVRDNMKHIEANFCLPLLARDELIGIIVLGSKVNGEAYSEQDIILLKSVASQASIAISNAQLYNEMEKIVRSQTKELRIKNKDLKETLKAKSNFLTVASHQLRTPTSVIKGMLDMLIDKTVPNNQREHYIQRCSAQACRLTNTIHDLLSSSAIEGKGFELNKKLTNIDELIANMVEERTIKLKQNNKEKQRDVKLIYQQPKTKTVPINIDPNKIEEVIANLIDNAIQYTLKGKIEIITKTDNKNFIFTIKDTGIGIEKEDMPKLFKKIARLPNAINICPDGTGLGLFIIKGMVEKHGGKVEVKSEGANKGSEFSFWLPRSKK